jgi:hypothetical protein
MEGLGGSAAAPPTLPFKNPLTNIAKFYLDLKKYLCFAQKD